MSLRFSELTPEALLAREALQNSGDAHEKTGSGAPVRVRITRRIVKGQELKQMAGLLLDGSNLRGRVKKLGFERLGLAAQNAFSKLLNPADHELELTIIEDFNTTGLSGALPNEHGAAADTDHFQKLLFLLGGTDKTKEESSGGSFGYGKSTYSALSDARTVGYYSVFDADERSNGSHARFILSSLFDHHTYEDRNHTGRAYLALPKQGGGPAPLVDEDAHRCAELLGLKKRTRDQKGTTIVIFGSNLRMDQIRSEIEIYWWPKLVDQDLHVELYDGPKMLMPPSPKVNESIRPYLTCYEILARRQEPDTANGQRRGKLNAREGVQPGEWAAVRVDGNAVEAEDSDDSLLNRVALIRGSKMVIEYSSKFCLPGAPVQIVGVFVANSDVDKVLKMSEPPAHNHLDSKSSRLDERGQETVSALLKRLQQQIREFHKELLPTPPPSNRRLRMLEELLGRLLEADPGVPPSPDTGTDPFEVTHNLKRKEKDGRVRIAGAIRIRLRNDAEHGDLKIEYVPKVEILEDEDRSSGDELPLADLRASGGGAKIEVKNKRKVVVGRLRKGTAIEIAVVSEPTSSEWLLAYREELRAVTE